MSQIDASEKDVLLAMAVATGTTLAAAAEQGGVCRRTVERRLADPAFRRLVADLRTELISRAVGRMADNMTRAADALADALADADPRLRIRAARALLTLGPRLLNSVDFADRLRDLEQELAQKQGVVP
ncbi:MAG: hypothetical protein ACJ8F7_16545 [Gemmataceae bacterium]